MLEKTAVNKRLFFHTLNLTVDLYSLDQAIDL